MVLTAELSLYPLQSDYLSVIQSFINDLNQQGNLDIVTNAMSTQVRGDYDAVMRAVSETLRLSAERDPRQVLVCKFIPMALDIV